ncbi:MAG: UDP-N-acetylmuramoyl-tripeptide--D-alanyl-D-alanine ligase [Pseudomonadota bacterium]|nr:UDP-N-acetylmuramoyl-tripeptide--D-alanyl-D-alanine ligase [Pseudomonadota bacterium]
MWTIERLAQATEGQWIQPLHISSRIGRIITDTRQIQAGDVFLALKGERFDAHDFVAQAAAAGAVAAIVARPIADVSIAQLQVADTRLALGALGAYHRQQFASLQVVALTGSSGKTTTKQMLGSILALSAPTLMTRGNLNNDLGVPMMLLELTADHQYAVMELGANHVGEIAYTTQLVQPQVAAVLNIGTAHLGEFGGREGIARAKSEIFQGLPASGTAIIPSAGDFQAVLAAAAAPYPTQRFGQGGEVFASAIERLPTHSQFILNTPDGQTAIQLPFAGQHNIDNALAAAACALALGIPLAQIATGLAQATNVKGRLAFHHRELLTVIDDTYNANPHSVRAAAQVLAAQAGVKVLVLGDIGELGDEAAAEHQALGQDLAAMDLQHVLAVGEYARHTIAGVQRQTDQISAHAYTDKASLWTDLQAVLAAQSGMVSVLFKGSRSTTMETLCEALLEAR